MSRLLASCLVLFVGALVSSAPAQSTTESSHLKTLNDHFPFAVPETVEAWEQRSEALRRRVLVANGLWPMPEKPAIEPTIFGDIQRDGFTVQKVYFESLPGHYVTGMLFRPAKDNELGVVDGKRPGVLSPHGHGGRTMRLSDDALAQQIESGGEKYEQSGRYPKLARCAHLARMGCVVFIFDMLGYADSVQVDYQTAHRHASPRPEEANRQQPCFFSIDADLNLQSIMGLQTWNAVRALDFLAELPDVDPQRLGVTGGSGGGTQTILLDAIDPRIKASFPNGMVSTSMQGGCYCENCNYLRIGTGNVELAALFAPKPQGMTAADDWTRDMMTDGYPELKKLYGMLGAESNVMCRSLLQFPHNYNYVTRATMYPWMAKHLGLPDASPRVEEDFQPFSERELAVWDDEHPAPTERGVEHERKVLAWWKQQSSRKSESVVPASAAVESSSADSSASKLAAYRELIGGAWRVIFDRGLPAKERLELRPTDASSADAKRRRVQVTHPEWNCSVDVTVFEPQSGPATRVVLYAGNPSQAIDEKLASEIATLTGDQQSRVIVPHLLPASIDDQGQPKQALIDDKRTYSAFTFGYNRPLAVKRFEQLLCALAAFPAEGDQQAWLIARGDQAIAAGAALAALSGDALDRVVLEVDGFRFAEVDDYSDANFIPGAAKYFDLPGLLALRAPQSLKIKGESAESMSLLDRVYQAVGAEQALQFAD